MAAAVEEDLTHTVLALANFTAEPLKEAFDLLGADLGVQMQLGGQEQVLQQLHSLGSRATLERDTELCIAIRTESWAAAPAQGDAAELLADAIERFRARHANHVSLLLMPATGAPAPAALVERIRVLPGVSIIGPQHWAQEQGAWEQGATSSQRHFGIQYPLACYASAAAHLVRAWVARSRRPHKVIVVDCDDTLWQGECAMAAPQELVIGEEHRLLQHWLQRKRSEGMLVCLCSKNSPEHVLAVFREHPGMVLKLDDIAAWRISWRRKSAEIADLARELNLNPDSFIFIDDSALECAEVRTALPDVLALQVPAGVHQRTRFLDHTWAFDAHESASALDRTALHRQEQLRQQTRAAADSYAGFIRNLGVRIDWRPLAPETLSRVQELLMRTNQFNLNGKVLSAAELADYLDGARRRAWTVDVADRFGSYGLSGAVLVELREEFFEVAAFVLSCRVLGRGVERRIATCLLDEAARAGRARVELRGSDTGRNEPALKFLRALAPAGHALHCVLHVGQALPEIDADESPATEPARSSAIHDEAVEQRRVDRCIRDPQWIEDRVRRWGSADAIAREVWPVLAVEPAGDNVEQRALRIWSRVLGKQVTQPDADFFSLGGTSMQLVHALAALEQQVGRCFSQEQIAELYGCPTVQAFVSLIESSPAGQGQAGVEIDAGGALPLSASQLALWFAHLQSPASGIYNVPGALVFDAGVALEELRAAIGAVIAHQEVLRTTYRLAGRSSAGIVADASEFSWVETDGTQWSQEQLLAHLELGLETPVSPKAGPALRAEFIHWRAGRGVLLLTCHHITLDFESLALLLEQVVAAYSARQAGMPASSLPPHAAFRKFAATQATPQWLQQGAQSATFWANELAGRSLRASRLSPSRATVESRPAFASGVLAAFDGEQSRRLQQLAEQHGVTRFTLLLSLYALYLRDWFSLFDMVIGTPMSLRPASGFGATLGNFVNLVPLRIVLGMNDDLQSTLVLCRRKLALCMRHKQYPLQSMLRVQAGRPTGRVELLDTLFAFHESERPWPATSLLSHGHLSEPFAIGGQHLRAFGLRHQAGIVPIGVNAHEAAGTIHVDVRYSVDYHTEDAARQFAGRFMHYVVSRTAR